MAALTAERVRKLKEHLVKALNDENFKIVDDLLENLKSVAATTELLKQTGIGVAVNSVRKNDYATEKQRSTAKALVAKWKNDVAASNGPSRKASNTIPLPRTAMSVNTTPKSETPSRRASDITTPTSASGGSERTIEGDKLFMKSTGDKVRDKCIGLLYTGLTLDSEVDGNRALPKAIAIEQVTYSDNRCTNGTYKARIRSLCFNLKDKSNPDLRDRVLSAQLDAEIFARMTTEEMASADRKKEMEKAMKESLEEAVTAADTQAETDMFQCGKCKQRKTKYFQMQTRSADEPMTTFVTCVHCGNKWKFC
ncbi:transcription factor S-II, central domain-containing protein [Phlyctochytrium arcticum]|nr:transcription factor S-II, central domain-containing protein [Phlyctochytrium arcticum]